MYIVLELQTTCSPDGDSTAVLQPITKADRNEAESVYHTILAAAAVSSVDIHAALIIDERGNLILRQSYDHTASYEHN